MKKLWLFFGCALTATTLQAQDIDTLSTYDIEGVTISVRRPGTTRISGAANAFSIGRDALFRAACCNLGESFTTNPSVDVSYNDATTGAKQIKLLGLSGTYVQMLTENLPNLRGAAAPYALDYVPGPWMQSIQVSKGAASVRNGYEGITGQIDVEYLKPDADQGASVNLYGNTMGRIEMNADGNLWLNPRLSSEVLMHFQNDYAHHDANDDGFLDQPNVRQWNLQNRWKWRGDRYLFHGGIALVNEKREGGQRGHASQFTVHGLEPGPVPFTTSIESSRYEGYMKHALVIDPEHGTNIALMGHVALHLTDALFGHKSYGINEKSAYAQLMFEHNFSQQHSLSAGLSFNHDYLNEELRTEHEVSASRTSLFTPGAYAQYTWTPSSQLTLMAGLRADHSSRYGWFATPRLHLKYTPHDVVTLRLSVGKGYRTVFALAENNYLLASGHPLVIDDNLPQESAWNYGISSALYIPLLGKTLKVNMEYYHTRFSQQVIIDYDSQPELIHITSLQGRSYSNTIQIDATYPLIDGMELTAAWRWNDVQTTYGHRLMEKPLTSRYKGLLSISYKPDPGLWQFDLTAQLNGGGRLPASAHEAWGERFSAYEQLSAQVTRWFRHFSIYVGGENLTGFRQQQTIIHAADPWSSQFDPTLIWGPVHGRLFYAGIRINIGDRL